MVLRNKPLAFGNNKATGLADGEEEKDAVNKGQLDSVAQQASDDLAGHETDLHPNISDKRIMANISGSPARPSANALSGIIDNIIGSTQGSILYRNATEWTKLDPGTSGQFLKTQGAAAHPVWDAVPVTPWTKISKSSDTSITSNTTLASDADLQFAMSANTNYQIRACVFTSSTAPTGGVKIGITGPSSPTRIIGTSYSSFIVSSVTYPIRYDATLGYGVVVSFNVTNIDFSWTFDLFIENGANAGTFAFQFAQQTSDAVATTFRKGSWLEYAEV